MTEGVDERVDKGILQWSCSVEQMEDDRITKRVYTGECAGSLVAQWVGHVRGGYIYYYYNLGSISQQAALWALYHRGRQRRVKDQT